MIQRMYVVVTGGRGYRGRPRVQQMLDAVHAQHPVTCVVHGGSAGAERFASEWARRNGVAEAVLYPDWDRHGRRAGVLCNGEMLTKFEPELVLSFPGGQGPKNLVLQARERGIRVVEVDQG